MVRPAASAAAMNGSPSAATTSSRAGGARRARSAATSAGAIRRGERAAAPRGAGGDAVPTRPQPAHRSKGAAPRPTGSGGALEPHRGQIRLVSLGMSSDGQQEVGPPASVYYRHSGRVPAASRLSLAARRAVYERFLQVIAPGPDDRILDIGVTSDTTQQESNFFERAYPHKHRVTCVGTEDGSHLERAYPGVTFVPITAGEPLPFPDGHFDVVFSNAVIEHAGGAPRQARFVAEALRVARRFFIVTPNRLFPVETHTGLPLVHYLPPALFRAFLNRAGYSLWGSEERLNLLTAASFARLFPAGAQVRVEHAGIGAGAFRSNLIAHGRSRVSGEQW